MFAISSFLEHNNALQYLELHWMSESGPKGRISAAIIFTCNMLADLMTLLQLLPQTAIFLFHKYNTGHFDLMGQWQEKKIKKCDSDL